MADSTPQPSLSLPADAWVQVALQLLNTTGRNDLLSLLCVNKELKSILVNHNTLWKSVVFSYFSRLFSKTDPATFSTFSASHWRRLLRCLLACGITPEPIKVDEDTYKPGPFARVPAWIKGLVTDGAVAEGQPHNEDNKHGETKLNPATWIAMRNAATMNDEEELLLRDGDIIYKFGYDVNTTQFWFSHEKAADGTPLHIRIGDWLNADAAGAFSALSEESTSLLENQELLQSFAKLVPHGTSSDLGVEPVLEVTACLTPIVPEFIPAASIENLLPEIIVENDPPENKPRNIGVYRYVMPRNSLPFLEHGASDVIHILLPLQDPDRVGFNEQRIKYYQDQMRAGAFPTVAAFTRVSTQLRIIEKQKNTVKQLIVVSLVLDGHHKLEAAARLKWPVGLLMFADHDRDFARLYYLNRPVPVWPFNERERNNYLTNEGPFTLLYDNQRAPVPTAEAEDRKRSIAKAVSCGDPNTDCVKRIIIPSAIKGWRDCLYHGGMIEFDSQACLIRALIYAQGQSVENDDPIALQVPTITSSPGWNFEYDLSSEIGLVHEHPPSDDEEDSDLMGQRYV